MFHRKLLLEFFKLEIDSFCEIIVKKNNPKTFEPVKFEQIYVFFLKLLVHFFYTQFEQSFMIPNNIISIG